MCDEWDDNVSKLTNRCLSKCLKFVFYILKDAAGKSFGQPNYDDDNQDSGYSENRRGGGGFRGMLSETCCCDK